MVILNIFIIIVFCADMLKEACATTTKNLALSWYKKRETITQGKPVMSTRIHRVIKVVLAAVSALVALFVEPESPPKP